MASIPELQKNYADVPYPARLMAVDHGEKTLGLAVSDSMQIVANPLETIGRKKLKDDLKKITQHIEEYDIKGIIFGLPLNMDGTQGPRCQAIQDYIREIQKHPPFDSLWIGLWDERLSTSAMDRFLIEQADVNRKRRKDVIDKMAAQHILQGAVDFLSIKRDA